MTMELSLQGLLQFNMAGKEDQETKTGMTGQIITGHHRKETCHLGTRVMFKEMEEIMLHSRTIARVDQMEGAMVQPVVEIFLLEREGNLGKVNEEIMHHLGEEMVTRENGEIPCLRIKEILTKEIEIILALRSRGTFHKVREEIIDMVAPLVLEIMGKIQALVTVEITDRDQVLVTVDKVMVGITDKEQDLDMGRIIGKDQVPVMGRATLVL